MKNRRLLTLIGSVCLTLVLTALLLPACAPATPEEAAGKIAELEDKLAASEKQADSLENEVSDLEKKLAKAEEATGPVPVEPEYKISVATPPFSPLAGKVYDLFVTLMNQKSDGRIEATHYGDGVLGAEEAFWEDTASGSVQMSHIATGNLVRWVPWASIATDLPFAWTSWFDYFAWGESVWIPEVNKELADNGLKMLPYLGTEGSSVIFSASGPIRSPADCEGKLFRAYSPGIEVAWMEALGSKATVIPWEELFTSLETGVVDLMHNPLRLCLELGFAEVTGDFTVTNHKIWGAACFVNLEWWNALPADLQDVVEDSWFTASAIWKLQNFNDNHLWVEKAQEAPYNMNGYIPTAAELAEFKAAMLPVYEQARKDYGDDKVDMMLDYAK